MGFQVRNLRNSRGALFSGAGKLLVSGRVVIGWTSWGATQAPCIPGIRQGANFVRAKTLLASSGGPYFGGGG